MAQLAQAETNSGVDIGEWFKDAVFWLLEEGERPIDQVRRLTNWINNTFLGDDRDPGLLGGLEWYVWPVAFFVVALLARRAHRGLRAAIALLAIRALGADIWQEVPPSLALIIVGVAMGSVLSLPITLPGVLSPGVRRAVRRIGDTSQLLVLVASSIPIVFFVGLGSASALWIVAFATVVPMTKAFGLAIDAAAERPREALGELAAGLNTSAILAVWLQAEIAIIGAGGLGRLLFRSTNNLNLSLFFTSTLALLCIGVALDQVTKPTARREGVFLDRSMHAWRLEPTSETLTPIPTTYSRTSLPTIVGAGIALVSLVLPWSTDRATVTSHVREADLDIPGASFNGLSQFGGGGFGLAVAVLAASALVGVALRAIRRSGPPVDFTSVVGGAITVLSAAYFVTAPGPFAGGSNVSVGAIVALVGGLIILLGTAIQRGGGAWSDIRDESRLGHVSTLLGLLLATGLIVLGSIAGWVVDQDPPNQATLTADVEAEIDRLTEEAGDDINEQIAAAQEIQELINSTIGFTQEPWHISGLHVNGPHTAFVTLGASMIAGLLTIAAAFGVERARWLAMGLAFGSALTAGAWIATTSSVQMDASLAGGGGPALVVLGAAALMAVARRAPRRVPPTTNAEQPEEPVERLEIPTIAAPPELPPEVEVDPDVAAAQQQAEALLEEAST